MKIGYYFDDNTKERKKYHRCVEYWINKGYTKEEAKKFVKNIYNTYSFDKYIERYVDLI